MTPRQLVGILLVSFSLFLGLVAGMLLWEQRGLSPAAEEPGDPDEDPQEPVPRSARPGSWAEGARAPVPRPPEADGRPSSGAPFDEGALREALGAATPAMQGCVQQWMAVDPRLGGRVTVALYLELGGLSAAEILDHQDPPAGPMACIGRALWGVDWPWPDSGRHAVRYTYQFFDSEVVGHVSGLAVGQEEDEEAEEDAEEEAGDSQ